MRRRDFLLHLSAAVPVATGMTWPRLVTAAEPPLPPGWRSFEIVTSVEVAAPAGRTQLWLPVLAKASSDLPLPDPLASWRAEMAEGSRSRTYQEAFDAPSRV